MVHRKEPRWRTPLEQGEKKGHTCLRNMGESSSLVKAAMAVCREEVWRLCSVEGREEAEGDLGVGGRWKRSAVEQLLSLCLL
jgi:hypothetical protein